MVRSMRRWKVMVALHQFEETLAWPASWRQRSLRQRAVETKVEAAEVLCRVTW